MAGNILPKLKIDRSVLLISNLQDESDEKGYWLTRTPQERLEQLEILRRINYGLKATGRLQKVLEIVERK